MSAESVSCGFAQVQLQPRPAPSTALGIPQKKARNDQKRPLRSGIYGDEPGCEAGRCNDERSGMAKGNSALVLLKSRVTKHQLSSL